MMSTDSSRTQLVVQLETALRNLVDSFCQEPYRCFTEADTHVTVQSWLDRNADLMPDENTRDGFKTGLVHREYPTFFRFDQHDSTRCLGPPARGGHYDLALLNPAYVRKNRGETVTNRYADDRGDLAQLPLLAVVELKLLGRHGWSPGTFRGIQLALRKLRLALQSPADAGAAYLCVLRRDLSGARSNWLQRHWPEVQEVLADCGDVRTAVAVCWPKLQKHFRDYSGGWIAKV